MLKVRPIYHWRERRVRAYLFVCLLAYYLERHLRRRLNPLPFAEEGEPEPAARSPRRSARRRPSARTARETLAGDLPLQSLPDLLASLSTLTAAELVYESVPGYAVPTLSAMTDLQRRAFKLLGLQPYPAPSLARPPAAGAPPATAPA